MTWCSWIRWVDSGSRHGRGDKEERTTGSRQQQLQEEDEEESDDDEQIRFSVPYYLVCSVVILAAGRFRADHIPLISPLPGLGKRGGARRLVAVH
ncbi:hypothetical protein MUK42_36409 [Musa troglodytarum]|uniref:Uncharacterized protein n=1 Tax=Musa troglodytarum TaxID=320322 RepID=A0A9E7JW30_9LILI|nr:hypothetical protein MUK42_36409 [Musa troglodytarum]